MFDWIMPVRFRKRKPVADERVVLLLAQIQDADPALVAIMELARDQFESETKEALRNDYGTMRSSPDGQQVFMPASAAEARAYQCGRAAGVLSLVDRIEAAREEGREILAQRMKENQKAK